MLQLIHNWKKNIQKVLRGGGRRFSALWYLWTNPKWSQSWIKTNCAKHERSVYIYVYMVTTRYVWTSSFFPPEIRIQSIFSWSGGFKIFLRWKIFHSFRIGRNGSQNGNFSLKIITKVKKQQNFTDKILWKYRLIRSVEKSRCTFEFYNHLVQAYRKLIH